MSLDGSIKGRGVFSGDAEGPIIWEVLYPMELWVLVYGDDETENNDNGPVVPALYATFSVTQPTNGKF